MLLKLAMCHQMVEKVRFHKKVNFVGLNFYPTYPVHKHMQFIARTNFNIKKHTLIALTYFNYIFILRKFSRVHENQYNRYLTIVFHIHTLFLVSIKKIKVSFLTYHINLHIQQMYHLYIKNFTYYY